MAPMWSINLVSKFVVAFNSLCLNNDGTIKRSLANFMETKVPANSKPVNGVSTFDVVIDSMKGVWVRFFVPTEVMEVTPLNIEHEKDGLEFGKEMPVIVYYHGGGFAVMCPNFRIYDVYCRRLARRCKALVLSVHYRRSPEDKYPTAYEDSYMALEWLRSEEASKHLPANVDLSRVFLSGDSAGGNIAHHVALRAAGKDLSPVSLKGAVLIQPFFGGEERTPAELRLKNVPIVSLKSLDWYWKAYLPPGANRDHPACNIFGPNSQDLSNIPFPPVLVVIGGVDILQDWERRYSEGMKKAGKDVQTIFFEEGIHTFGLFNQVNVAEQMMLDIITFINNH